MKIAPMPETTPPLFIVYINEEDQPLKKVWDFLLTRCNGVSLSHGYWYSIVTQVQKETLEQLDQ